MLIKKNLKWRMLLFPLLKRSLRSKDKVEKLEKFFSVCTLFFGHHHHLVAQLMALKLVRATFRSHHVQIFTTSSHSHLHSSAFGFPSVKLKGNGLRPYLMSGRSSGPSCLGCWAERLQPFSVAPFRMR